MSPVPTFFLFLHDCWVASEGHRFAVTEAVWGLPAGLCWGKLRLVVNGAIPNLWGSRTSQYIPQDQGFFQSQAYCFSCWLFESLSLGEGLPAKTLPLNLANLPGAGMVSWMISAESTAEKWSLPDTGGRVLSFTWGRSKHTHSFWNMISTPCSHSHYNFLKVISNFHLIWWVKFNHKQSSSTRSKCHFRTRSHIQIIFFFGVPMPWRGSEFWHWAQISQGEAKFCCKMQFPSVTILPWLK